MLERLRRLRPWDNINEEDLFRVDGLLLSFRGNIHRPEGVWCTAHEANARRWVFQPESEPAPEDWCLNAETGEIRPGNELPLQRVENAIEQAVNSFDDKPCQGVEFPICFNLDPF